MKKSTLVCALLLVVLPIDDLFASVDPPPPPPTDTTIRILIIADDRLSVGDITAAISYLNNSWNNTNFSTATPTTLTIANNGNPIPADENVFSGDEEDQIDNIRDLADAPVIPTITSLRDYHAADVVIGLSSDLEVEGLCGSAPQGNWLGLGPFPFFGPNFEQTSGVHDLRKANDDYIAIIQITGPLSCRPYLAAHEFGHLLGGGHWDSIYKFNGGLLSNSKARRTILPPPIYNPYHVWISALGLGPETVDCPFANVSRCVHLERFSDYDFGTSTYRNADALRKTARSVANYRSGTGTPVQPPTCSDGIDNDDDNFVDSADSDCAVCNEELCPTSPNPPPNCDATIAPTGMIGWVLEVCVPGTTYTKYQVVWSHACPQQVLQYEVWAAQPTSDPFTLRWSVVPPHTRPIVGGVSARIKVKSCGVGGCSGLSSSSFLAVDLC